MKSFATLLGASAAALLASSAGASTIYSNGPANGNLFGWTINFGYQVADSFTAAPGSTATSMSFETWAADALSTDTPQTVDWAIVNGNPLGGGTFTIIDSGTASITATALGLNGALDELFSDTISLPNVALTCGSNCWIELQNGVTADGQPMYWDNNDGPSDAWENTIGDRLHGWSGNVGFKLSKPSPFLERWASARPSQPPGP